jgi:hypothetical protein
MDVWQRGLLIVPELENGMTFETWATILLDEIEKLRKEVTELQLNGGADDKKTD